MMEQALQGFALLVVVAAVGVYLAAPALAWRWTQLPFLGTFVEVTNITNDVGQANPAFQAFAAGVRAEERLIALNGVPVPTDGELDRELARRAPGDTVRLTLEQRDGSLHEVSVGLTRFPFQQLLTFFIIPYFIGLTYLGIGLWVFRLRRSEPAGRAFAVFCGMVAVTMAGLFDFYTTHDLLWAWTIAVPGIGAAFINLGLVFPQEIDFLRRQPVLRLLIGWGPLVALAGYTLFSYVSGDPWLYLSAWVYQDLFVGVGILFFLGTMLYRWRASASPLVRQQSRLILLGALAAASLILVWVGQLLASQLMGSRAAAAPFNPLNFLPTVLLPGVVAYSILRYRLLDTDRLIGQALVYAGLGVLSLAAYGLVLTGASLLLGSAVAPNEPVVVAVVVFLLVVAFNPLRERLQRTLDDTFFRGARAFAQRVEAFGRALTRATGLDDIHAALGEHIGSALRPAHFFLFLQDRANDVYAPYAPRVAAHRTDVRFGLSGALATSLARERLPLVLSADRPLPESLQADRARLAVLGSALYVPLTGKSGLSGWLAVGPKLSGEPFSSEDVQFVETLVDQSALAIERATVISDLERRVNELNVLSQMSQAVNFTLAFDDLLELVYAQASKVVVAHNFFIVLKDVRSTSFSYVFYLENDERDSAEENKPWPADRGLSVEIVRTGQPIRTDDYHAECRRRNVAPRPKSFKAWMGVPLNAGAETIGAMAVAAFESGVIYTEEQLKIFWAIADQAASAIVKARLYQQSEQRARQLATLNEVSTSMSSTLEIEALLQRIVQSSVDILECEAGSLFLTDEETGEYIFRVAVGPVGQNLVGMRIAPGRGFVGEAIESGLTLIVNDVQNDPRWFKGTDQSSGFVTHALMVVPLRFQGRAIGAVEVINKRDGSLFNEDDQNLLTAFAGPAAVAIQNARLFTMTDQALAARVEELSVMQRIDRELNTVLDTRRVLAITLGWALRNTGAAAGAVGLLDGQEVELFAVEGAGLVEAELVGRRLPAGAGNLGQAVRSGEVSLARGLAGEPRGLLEAARAQVAIPIKGEQRVMGVLMLESLEQEDFTPDEVAFVVRLVDHASIAISNARLYAEVQAANLAKSEFVSFVAHELKTPMTSIKGYADLLLGGAVGPVNDMQRQFLGTVRGNVERMATLVSDLADVARIESGRLRLEFRPLPVQAVVDDVVRTTQAMIDAKKQALVQEIEPNLPPLLADATRAAQVLTNLMSNAYKYTPEGGEIVLRITREANRWDPDGAPEVMLFAVRDNGIGISPDDQKKLFQKFFRAEDRMAREMASGTGLGLNIVKNLVELQGGRIWFESEFRKGSTFYFTLPLAADGAKAGVPGA